MVAIEEGADLQTFYVVGVDFFFIYPVDPESCQVVLLCEEAKPVTVLKVMMDYSEKFPYR
jgi:hypothetical protein